jgi:hypothetical protein
VVGTEGGSGKTVPLRIEPERGQVGEHGAEEAAALRREDAGDVFHEQEAGSQLASEPDDLGPQVPLVGAAAALPAGAVGLTGEPATKHVRPGNGS